MGQESGHDLAESPSQSLPQAVVKVLLGCSFIWRLCWGRTHFLTHARVVGKTQFLKGCWTEGLSSPLVVGWRLTSVSCHVGLSSLLHHKEPERVQMRQKSQPLITQSQTCHRVYPILFIRSKLLHTQGRGIITQGNEYWETGVIGSHLRIS